LLTTVAIRHYFAALDYWASGLGNDGTDPDFDFDFDFDTTRKTCNNGIFIT